MEPFHLVHSNIIFQNGQEDPNYAVPVLLIYQINTTKKLKIKISFKFNFPCKPVCNWTKVGVFSQKSLLNFTNNVIAKKWQVKIRAGPNTIF